MTDKESRKIVDTFLKDLRNASESAKLYRQELDQQESFHVTITSRATGAVWSGEISTNKLHSALTKVIK